MNQNKDLDIEIYKMEKRQELIDSHIKELWDNIILPYLQDNNKKQILTKLTINDYDKFYKFMINENLSYKDMNNKIKKLYEFK